MTYPTISAASVHLALRTIRAASPLDNSPLLDLDALVAAMKQEGLVDSTTNRTSFLPRWLAGLAESELDRLRGDGVAFRNGASTPATGKSALAAARSADRQNATDDRALSILRADFRSGRTDRDAWALLNHYYFSGSSDSLRELAARLPAGINTVRRRLDRGCHLLADVLTAKEREAGTAARARTVPRPYTRFIGREAELGAIRQHLAASRLVVLTGPGGVGKSRLAVRLAHDLAADYPDDAWFIEIAALADGRQVAQAAMRVLGLREASGRSHADTLADYLADKRLLLVIDNCEHLEEWCSALIRELLRRCEHLQVLATSRVKLRVDGAAHWSVPALALPKDITAATVSTLIHFDAPRLFSARAAAAEPGFHLTDLNAAQVGGICVRLDGLPLAIELAAARVPELSLDQLESRLADRFALLKDGRHATRRSHETLRAMMDWSYDLLSPPEQLLLQRLAVFRGGWTMEAAAAVCTGNGIAEGDVAQLLTRLAAKSLVNVRETGDERRYEMLETVREYAEQRLIAAPEPDKVRLQHIDYFILLAERLHGSRLATSNEAWLDRLEVELPNCRAALAWAEQVGDTERVLRLCSTLTVYWYDRAHYAVGAEATLDVLRWAGGSAASAAQAATRRGLAMLLIQIGRIAEAREQLQASKAMYEALGDAPGMASATRYLGYASECEGDLEAARANYREAAETFKVLDDNYALMGNLISLGMVNVSLGDYTEARVALLSALNLADQSGATRGMGHAAEALGNLEAIQGNLERAAHYFERQLAANLTLKHPINVAAAQVNLAWVENLRCNHAAAAQLASAGLATSREHRVTERAADALIVLGEALSHLGDNAEAQAHFAEATAICRQVGYKHHEGTALYASASAYLRAGIVDEVRTSLCQGIEIFRAVKAPRQVIQFLELFVQLADLQREPARVARLMGASQAQRERLGAALTPAGHKELDPPLDRARASLGEATFNDLAAEGARMTLEEAVAYATGEGAASGAGDMRLADSSA